MVSGVDENKEFTIPLHYVSINLAAFCPKRVLEVQLAQFGQQPTALRG